ncbi:MAG TPA: DUF58 domain-containing protein [Longimicrobiales bacterium]|nr:DUF58 domain-containing protein [Longimicrobiales bacterium]
MRWKRPSEIEWARVRRWFKPPRRLYFTRGGGFFTAGAFAIGLAAINTGDNLLYLLLGAMMGFIAVSGWLSEQVVRGIEVRALPPHAATAGTPTRIGYEVRNRKRWMPSYALEVIEPDGGRAYSPVVRAGHDGVVRAQRTFDRRGVYRLEAVTLATSFPFGLFIKTRDVDVRGEVVVWPRRDRPVREPATGGRKARRHGQLAGEAAGSRGEFRGLREYRPGDDPRDVHWRSSARLGLPLVREYERDAGQTVWLCLDLRTDDEDAADLAAETVAALANRAAQRHERFGMVTPDVTVAPGQDTPQLERVLDALARASFRRGAGLPRPPVPASECLLVTAAAEAGEWGDVYAVAGGGR